MAKVLTYTVYPGPDGASEKTIVLGIRDTVSTALDVPRAITLKIHQNAINKLDAAGITELDKAAATIAATRIKTIPANGKTADF